MWRMSSHNERVPKYREDIKKSEEESFINALLTNKLDDLQHFDPEVSHKLMEDMHHSELARIFENADERDLLTVCYVAVRRFPLKYLTVLMDYILEKEGFDNG
jgi:hypothetical protein